MNEIADVLLLMVCVFWINCLLNLIRMWDDHKYIKQKMEIDIRHDRREAEAHRIWLSNNIGRKKE